MQKLATTIPFLFFYSFIFSQIAYVNLEATGNNDGSSWKYAYTNLKVALEKMKYYQMKNLVILMILLGAYTCGAQSYNEVLSPEIIGVQGTFKFGDLDGDDDLDIIVVGRARVPGTSLRGYAAIYLNDGNGNFETTTSVLKPVGNSGGDIQLFDADNDNDLDILIIGENNDRKPETSLYFNDGQGNFIEDGSEAFSDFGSGEIGTTDVDEDGDLDVFISGDIAMVSTEYEPSCELYLNLGEGVFTRVYNTPFKPISGSVSFSDLNSDGSPDLIIAGQDPTYEMETVIYINNGFGVFNETIENQISNLAGDVVCFDIDGDEDNDIIISGVDSPRLPRERFMKVYLNQGGNNFIEIGGSEFIDVSLSTIDTADFDNDGDIDILVTGIEYNGESIFRTKLYTNNGVGQFFDSGEEFLNVSYGDAKFGDIDGDADLDILVMGVIDFNHGWSARMYKNNILTSIENTLEIKSPFYIFPNPSVDGHISIQIPNGSYKVMVTDLKGSRLFAQEIDDYLSSQLPLLYSYR